MHHGDVDSLRNQTKDGISYKGPVIGLMRDRDQLYERINLRVDMMFDAGLIEEVEQLVKSGVNPDCQAFKGIGYKEVVDYINGTINLDECRDLIKKKYSSFCQANKSLGISACHILNGFILIIIHLKILYLIKLWN